MTTVDVAAPGPDLGHNVVALGVTSLFTDVSAEMVASVLPVYLTTALGFGPMLFGVVDGAYQAFAALAAVGAAVGADRTRRRKLVAGTGYALSTVCTLGLSALRGTWEAVVGLLYVSRLGKGLRTAPRDAILSLSVTPDRLGRAFGVHRAFDTVGAVAGPVAAAALLAREPNGYGIVFTVGFLVAVVGLATFTLLVRDVAPGTVAAHRTLGPRMRSVADTARIPGFRVVVVAGIVLALVRPGDGQLFLAHRHSAELWGTWFPMQYAAASVVFLLAAAPLGLLADRIGAVRVLAIGGLSVAGALAVPALGRQGPLAWAALVMCVGLSYAATDGVLMVAVAGTVGAAWRTTGLAAAATAFAAGRFCASAVFGAVWEAQGPQAAARLFAVGALAAALAVIVIADRGPHAQGTGRP